MLQLSPKNCWKTQLSSNDLGKNMILVRGPWKKKAIFIRGSWKNMGFSSDYHVKTQFSSNDPKRKQNSTKDGDLDGKN